MPVNSVGIVTARDELTIDIDKEALWYRVEDFARTDIETLRSKYALGNDAQDWTVTDAKADVLTNFDRIRLTPIAYRPFDTRWMYYTGTARGFQCRPRNEVTRHLLEIPNFAFGYTRTIEGGRAFADIAVYDQPITHHTLSIKEVNAFAPLYLYPDNKAEQHDAFASVQRVVNLDPKLYTAICRAAGIDPADQAGPDDDFRTATGLGRPSEVKLFDYIYGVLHAPNYRETFAEFLKIDFPRIPYPPSPEVFRHVSDKGEQLRRLHLMEAPAIGETPWPYHGEGDDVVASGYPKFEKSSPSGGGGRREAADGGGAAKAAAGAAPPLHHPADGPPPPKGEDPGRVHINKGQYFDGVPEIAWTFHIGGYQPARKWLKDRRGRVLSFDDIAHYQRIVKILVETDRIMKEIDLPLD